MILQFAPLNYSMEVDNDFGISFGHFGEYFLVLTQIITDNSYKVGII